MHTADDRKNNIENTINTIILQCERSAHGSRAGNRLNGEIGYRLKFKVNMKYKMILFQNIFFGCILDIISTILFICIHGATRR